MLGLQTPCASFKGLRELYCREWDVCGSASKGYLKKVTGMQPFKMALNSRVVSCVAPGAHTQKRDLAMSASVSCIGSMTTISPAAALTMCPEETHTSASTTDYCPLHQGVKLHTRQSCRMTLKYSRLRQ